MFNVIIYIILASSLSISLQQQQLHHHIVKTFNDDKVILDLDTFNVNGHIKMEPFIRKLYCTNKKYCQKPPSSMRHFVGKEKEACIRFLKKLREILFFRQKITYGNCLKSTFMLKVLF